MESQFLKHREKFDSLVAMVKADLARGYKVSAVPPDCCSGRETTIPEQRVALYQAQMNPAGIRRLSVNEDGSSITFFRHSVSLMGFKTYEYAEVEPDTVYASLNPPPANIGAYGVAHRRLDENWYIVYCDDSD